jgi:hypothetical protein
MGADAACGAPFAGEALLLSEESNDCKNGRYLNG